MCKLTQVLRWLQETIDSWKVFVESEEVFTMVNKMNILPQSAASQEVLFDVNRCRWLIKQTRSHLKDDT